MITGRLGGIAGGRGGLRMISSIDCLALSVSSAVGTYVTRLSCSPSLSRVRSSQSSAAPPVSASSPDRLLPSYIYASCPPAVFVSQRAIPGEKWQHKKESFVGQSLLLHSIREGDFKGKPPPVKC